MAKECLIIGRPNVGKSLFMVNFAEYLGNSSVNLLVYANGEKVTRSLSVREARQLLVSEIPHHTRCHQSIELRIPSGKGKKKVTITDTGGLSEGIHRDATVRRAMAFTISSIRTTRLILHVIDAPALGKAGNISGLSEIDFQIAQFARATKGYLILANKMDLPDSGRGYHILAEEFPEVPVLPISALMKTGLKEVRKNVARFL